jgi:hypothetical protein
LLRLIVLAVLAAGVLWLAGEKHRENCFASGKKQCSVLPWASGESPANPMHSYTRRECLLLKAEELRGGEPAPSQC